MAEEEKETGTGTATIDDEENNTSSKTEENSTDEKQFGDDAPSTDELQKQYNQPSYGPEQHIDTQRNSIVDTITSRFKTIHKSYVSLNIFLILIFIFGIIYHRIFNTVSDLFLHIFSFSMLIFFLVYTKKGNKKLITVYIITMYYSFFSTNYYILIFVLILTFLLQIVGHLMRSKYGKGTIYDFMSLTDNENFFMSLVYFLAFFITSKLPPHMLANIFDQSIEITKTILSSEIINYLLAVPWWTVIGLFIVIFIIKIKKDSPPHKIAKTFFYIFIVINLVFFFASPIFNILSKEDAQQEVNKLYKRVELEFENLNIDKDSFFENEYGEIIDKKPLPSYVESFFRIQCWISGKKDECVVNKSLKYACEPIKNKQLKDKCLKGDFEESFIFVTREDNEINIKDTAGSSLSGINPKRAKNQSIKFDVDIKNVQEDQKISYTCNFKKSGSSKVNKTIKLKEKTMKSTKLFQDSGIDCTTKLDKGVWNLDFIANINNAKLYIFGTKYFTDETSKFLNLKDHINSHSNILKTDVKFKDEKTILRNKVITFDLIIDNPQMYEFKINNLKIISLDFKPSSGGEIVELGPFNIKPFGKWERQFNFIPKNKLESSLNFAQFTYLVIADYDYNVTLSRRFQQI